MSKAITTTRRTSGISNFVFKGGEGKLREMTMFFADIRDTNGFKYGDFVLECFGYSWAHRFPTIPEGITTELYFLMEEPMAMATLMIGTKPGEDSLLVNAVRAAQDALRKHLASETIASPRFAEVEEEVASAAAIMTRAHALCPPELSHQEKMNWIASYFVASSQPANIE